MLAMKNSYKKPTLMNADEVGITYCMVCEQVTANCDCIHAFAAASAMKSGSALAAKKRGQPDAASLLASTSHLH